MPARDRLRAAKLRTGGVIGSEVIVLEETASTNDVVAEMAYGDWPEGLCVLAEKQTAGRGQRGNAWESVAGKGLWLSILLRPAIEIKDSPRLSEWAARIVAATIERELHVAAAVKLPNDVYVGGRKVAGVLVEMKARPAAPHVAVVGIGINVNHAPSDFSEELRERATSLAILHHGPVDRQSFAFELLQMLDRTYQEVFRL